MYAQAKLTLAGHHDTPGVDGQLNLGLLWASARLLVICSAYHPILAPLNDRSDMAV